MPPAVKRTPTASLWESAQRLSSLGLVKIRPGQRWRDVSQPGGAQIISVDDVTGNTVQGSYAPEAVAGVTGAGAWSLADFERMTLVHDPDWPVHRVVVRTAYDLELSNDVHRAMRPVGILGGARSMEPSGPGTYTGLAWWDVVAPSEADAIQQVRDAVGHIDADLVDVDSIHVNNREGRGI